MTVLSLGGSFYGAPTLGVAASNICPGGVVDGLNFDLGQNFENGFTTSSSEAPVISVGAMFSGGGYHSHRRVVSHRKPRKEKDYNDDNKASSVAFLSKGLRERGKWDKAHRLVMDGLTQFHEHPILLSELAVIQLNSRDTITAEQTVMRIFEQEPENQRAMALMSMISSNRGDRDGAISWLRHSLERGPGSPISMVRLAELLMEKEEGYPEAIVHLERAVKSPSFDNSTLVSLVIANWTLGRFEECVKAADRAIARMPRETVVRHHKASALKALGRPREALEVVDNLLKLRMPSAQRVIEIRAKIVLMKILKMDLLPTIELFDESIGDILENSWVRSAFKGYFFRLGDGGVLAAEYRELLKRFSNMNIIEIKSELKDMLVRSIPFVRGYGFGAAYAAYHANLPGQRQTLDAVYPEVFDQMTPFNALLEVRDLMAQSEGDQAHPYLMIVEIASLAEIGWMRQARVRLHALNELVTSGYYKAYDLRNVNMGWVRNVLKVLEEELAI